MFPNGIQNPFSHYLNERACVWCCVGHVEQVDLRGNICEYQPSHDTMLAEFQHNRRPILVLPSSVALNIPYDDDP